LIALISIVVLALLGLLWWWVVHPQPVNHRELRKLPLPLYTSRTPGRGINVVVPSLGPSLESAGMMAASAVAPAVAKPSTPRPVADADAEPVRPTSGQGPTLERVFTTLPWVEPEAVKPTARPAAAGASDSPASNGNGRGAEAPSTMEGLAAAPARPPLRSAPRGSAPPRAPRKSAAPAVTESATDEARWAPPAERDPAGTIQFLPGRLEVLQGRTMEGQEIRFVRPERAGDRAVVTFGRGDGAPYRHVQLKVPTVSRLHARMALEPGSDAWTLENLSSTNPVAVNGVDLAADASPVALGDGDRIEMGEIVFVFRAR